VAAIAPSHTHPRFAMRGIRKRFGATMALDGVDFEVFPGEVHALVGENGAGKSTLMKVLSGALRPDAGSMEIDGISYSPRSAHDARRAGVAMIYQELSLAPHLSVEDNVMLGMEPGHWGMRRRPEIRHRTMIALEQLGHGSLDPTTPIGTLPIATRQIVEIARALAVGCRVLVLDEPTSSLALEDIERLFEVISVLRSQGHAIVYISHFLEEVKRISNSYTVLRDGRTAGRGSTDAESVDGIVRLMIGRRIDQLYPRSARTPGEMLVDVASLLSPPKTLHVSFNLHRGEILGIGGLIGAGRTELVRALFGLAPITSGRVRMKALNGWMSPAARWNAGIGMVSEDRSTEGLALSMTIADNITLTLRKDVGPFGLLSPSRLDNVARTWIERIGIRSAGPRQQVSALSGGNQQKVALARLLHEDVDILLLDEPTRGIDVASKAQFYDIINRLAAGDPSQSVAPKAILMISSYLPELLGVCDRIAIMHRGRLGPLHPVHLCTEHMLMLEATGQRSAS
jgi:ribose transport system ATP-binding protein